MISTVMTEIDLSGDLSAYSWQQIEQAMRARTAETNGYASLMEEPPETELVELPEITDPEPMPSEPEQPLPPLVEPQFRAGPHVTGSRNHVRAAAVSRERAEQFMFLYDEHQSFGEVAKRVNESSGVVQQALLRHGLIDEVDLEVEKISRKTYAERLSLEEYGRAILNRARVGALTDDEERIMDALARINILEEVDERDDLPAYLRLHTDYSPKRRSHRYTMSARQRRQDRWAADPRASRPQVQRAMRSMGLLPR